MLLKICNDLYIPTLNRVLMMQLQDKRISRKRRLQEEVKGETVCGLACKLCSNELPPCVCTQVVGVGFTGRSHPKWTSTMALSIEPR